VEETKRAFKDYLLLYAKGLGMGAVDIVPGVSGGTIAFITGVYEEFINSLRSFTLKNIQLFLSGKFKAFWEAVNGSFLLVLAMGIGTSVRAWELPCYHLVVLFWVGFDFHFFDTENHSQF
jgi:putative membrane protein